MKRVRSLTMALTFSRCKNLTFSFILFCIALFLLVTNHLYFIINYSKLLRDEFQDASTHLKIFKNPDWLEVFSQDIIDKSLKIGSVNMNRFKTIFPVQAQKKMAPYHKGGKSPSWFEVVRREFKPGKINIGLVNAAGTMDEVRTTAKVVEVQFDRVKEDIHWSDLIPAIVDENSTCPDIPMPRFEHYAGLDVVIARVPSSIKDKGGLKDVFRLQVNLVVANLLVRSGRRGIGPLLAVFVDSLDPMWEVFRCDDLLWNEGNTWIYKPELERIRKLVLMPVGPCQLVPPSSDFDAGSSIVSPLIGGSQQLKSETADRPREAYVTVLHSSEAYVCGAILLAQSLIQSNTTKDLILLADDNISPGSIKGLRSAGWKIRLIERLRSPYSRKDAYNEWNYSKLRIWQLKQYEKVMLIDADIMVIKNLDEFFAYPQLSAAGNSKKLFFNSGLMVVEPSQCTFDMLMKKMMVVKSYNAGDQGFLNEVFAWWHRLPDEVNFMKVFVEEEDHEHGVDEDVYGLHYIGRKPWECSDQERDCNWDEPTLRRYASDSMYRMWWRVYRDTPEKLRSYCWFNSTEPRVV